MALLVPWGHPLRENWPLFTAVQSLSASPTLTKAVSHNAIIVSSYKIQTNIFAHIPPVLSSHTVDVVFGMQFLFYLSKFWDICFCCHSEQFILELLSSPKKLTAWSVDATEWLVNCFVEKDIEFYCSCKKKKNYVIHLHCVGWEQKTKETLGKYNQNFLHGQILLGVKWKY